MYAGRIVETGPVLEVIRRPAHPYTRGLMGSIPSLATKSGRLVQIDGGHAAPGARALRLRPSARAVRRRSPPAPRRFLPSSPRGPPARRACASPRSPHERPAPRRRRPVVAADDVARWFDLKPSAFDRVVLRKARAHGEGRRRPHLRDSARHDLRRRRRERLRQVHARPVGRRPARAEPGRHPLRGGRRGATGGCARADDFQDPSPASIRAGPSGASSPNRSANSACAARAPNHHPGRRPARRPWAFPSATPGASRTSSPVASASASRSPARSPPSPSSSSATRSRRRRSTFPCRRRS